MNEGLKIGEIIVEIRIAISPGISVKDWLRIQDKLDVYQDEAEKVLRTGLRSELEK